MPPISLYNTTAERSQDQGARGSVPEWHLVAGGGLLHVHEIVQKGSAATTQGIRDEDPLGRGPEAPVWMFGRA